MGVELHITRADHWSDNDSALITQEEWLAFVRSDPELELLAEFGPCFVKWLGDSKSEEPWLDWDRGNISTKWPDTALYLKMLDIASALHARVQDDDGATYRKPSDWSFDPTASAEAAPSPRKSWIQRIFGR